MKVRVMTFDKKWYIAQSFEAMVKDKKSAGVFTKTNATWLIKHTNVWGDLIQVPA